MILRDVQTEGLSGLNLSFALEFSCFDDLQGSCAENNRNNEISRHP